MQGQHQTLGKMTRKARHRGAEGEKERQVGERNRDRLGRERETGWGEK